MSIALQYPYLQDNDFLKQIDKERIRDQYVRIIVLTKDENVIQSIEGRVSSGSITINGDSAIRRSATLTVLLDDDESADYSDPSSIFFINRKIKLEIGYKNQYVSNKYSNFDILWFPLGVYGITGVSISHTTTGLSVNLTLQDKMCFLNGTCGGTINQATTFNEIEQYDDIGELYIDTPTIFTIIQTLVHDFGEEDYARIIVNDIDETEKRMIQWGGDADIPNYNNDTDNKNSSFCYKMEQIIIPDDATEEEAAELKASADFTRTDTKGNTIYDKIVYFPAEDVYDLKGNYSYTKPIYQLYDVLGYEITDFTWPEDQGDLVANAGDTVVTILDKIKNVLGNYEYYYDLDGNFVFQEIKNYLNNSYSTSKKTIENLDSSDYVVDRTSGRAVYSFDDSSLISSYINNPQYNMIKNDFVVWGTKKDDSTGESIAVRYHLAIDNKPAIGNTYSQVTYYDSTDGNVNTATPLYIDSIYELPETGTINTYFYVEKDPPMALYTWAQIPEYNINNDPTNGYRYEDRYDEYYVLWFTTLDDAVASGRIPSQENKYLMIGSLDDTEFTLYTETEDKVNGKSVYDFRPFMNLTFLGGTNESGDALVVMQEKDGEKTGKILFYGEPSLEDAYKEIVQKLMDIKKQEGIYDGVTLKIGFSKYLDNRETYITDYVTTDWRSELYFSGKEAMRNNLDKGFYYEELSENWPEIYDIEAGKFKDEYIENKYNLNYYLDFIDSNSSLMNYSVSNIGRRSYASSDDNINCVFEPDVPEQIVIVKRRLFDTYGYYSEELSEKDFKQQIADAIEKGYQEDEWVILDSFKFIDYVDANFKVGEKYTKYTLDNNDLNNYLPTAADYYSAFSVVQDLLYQYTSFNEAITLTSMPIYHLEPNTRITVHDYQSNIHGDFMIKQMTIPLTIDGTMNISCNRCLERFY